MTATDPVRFGVNYLPGPAAETLRWAQAAEEANPGFDIVGIADSQSAVPASTCSSCLRAERDRHPKGAPRAAGHQSPDPAPRGGPAGAAATLERDGPAPGRTMLGTGTGDQRGAEPRARAVEPGAAARLRRGRPRASRDRTRGLGGPSLPHDVG